MTKRKLLISIASLILLVATHRFAYNGGVEYSIANNAPLRDNIQAMNPYAEILCQVDVLRVVAKRPDGFSTEELRKWRTETETTLPVVETTTLDYCRKTGDEGQEQRVRAKIREAHDLLAKLPK